MKIPSCMVVVWGHIRSRLIVPTFTTHKRNWDVEFLRFAAYTGQTVESAESHARMDKCIVVLSAQSPTSKTHRENEIMERVQKEEYSPWRMTADWNDIPSAGLSRRVFFQDLRKILSASKLWSRWYLHNYGHANSNRPTVFFGSPCAWLKPYLRIQ
jgi:hypothetical protein